MKIAIALIGLCGLILYCEGAVVKHCEPGSTFMDDCNTCTCLKDGVNKVCTLMECHANVKRQTDITGHKHNQRQLNSDWVSIDRPT